VLTVFKKHHSTETLAKAVVVLALCYFLLSICSNALILTDGMYADYYQDQVDSERMSEIISKTRSFNTLKAIWEPISHLLNVIGTAFCLYLACHYKEEKIEFKSLFGLSLTCYYIFLIPALAKFFYFSVYTELSIPDYNSFSFGSLSFLTSSADPYWLKSLLETFTLFELLYWILLAYGLTKAFEFNFDDALKIVLGSYVVALTAWILVRIYVQMIVFNLS